MRRRGAVIATTAAFALTLAACGGETADDNGTTDPGTDTGTEDTDTEDTDDTDTGAADAEPITIGVFSGWEEGIAVSHLWQRILTDQGYEVEMETAEAGIVFTGLAQGDYDVNFDTWLPLTHGSYLEEYGDDIEELGMWLEEAPLTLAVNEDAPITSIDELAELQGAIDRGDNIVVTLWRPHWAYDAFPIRDLEDPEGAMGEADDIYTYGTAGFSEEYPEVAEWMANFTMTHDELHSLENIMFNELDGADNDGAVDQWLEDNPDFVDNLIGG